MNSRRPQTLRSINELLLELHALERSGKFEQSLIELRGIWDDVTTDPVVDDLDARVAANIYLRCGALIGFLGHSRQLPSAQDRSRNLLTRARSAFLESYQPEKIVECENYLALAYWRTGETNEAESWIEESRSHDIPDDSDARLYSHVIRQLILFSQKRFAEIYAEFGNLEETFVEHADNFVAGNFYMNFGLAAKNLGDIAEALDAVQKSRDYFTQAGNRIQLAMAENNLSQLYKIEGRFDEAHLAIDRATDLFKTLGDRTREGYSLDSKALIYLDEEKFDTAIEAVEQGIALLRKSENYGYLTETIATKARIQLFANDFSTATLTLLEAVELAKMRISEQAAVRLVRDFEQALEDRNATRSRANKPSPEKSGIASDDLKLVLPTSISHYDDYQGVWINNSDLELYGLKKGSLAVVVPEKIGRGDLVALVELKTDLVSCGFYDCDFGIVCLEAGGSEPQLFDKSDVKILGKIVGVSDAKRNSDGSIEVRPLDL
jgi:tetratricopeptide (TPR) repeat protein